MLVEEKLNLIREVGEEIIGESELENLLRAGSPIIAYDGFEPSGRIHLAQGLLRVININKIIRAGIKFKILVADWHALANNKMGGNLTQIQKVGRYFIEVWQAAGLSTDKVEFVWASDLVKNSDYWKLVLRIAQTNSIRRFIRTAEIMGREESFDLSAAQIIYPCMQIADIFSLGAQITQLGLDQRKVNVLAREIGEITGFWKPIVISHHMLRGLGKPIVTGNKLQKTLALKMSKSKPGTAIFMTDTETEIRRKITKAYCPPNSVADNPIFEYFRYIIFEKPELKDEQGNLIVKGSSKVGGVAKVPSIEVLEKLYLEGAIHPLDLKEAATDYLNKLLQPVRSYFVNNDKAAILKEEVEGFEVTR